MTATALIQKLSQLMAIHGDQNLEVTFWEPEEGFTPVQKVAIGTQYWNDPKEGDKTIILS